MTGPDREGRSREDASRALVAALQDPRCFDHPVEKLELFETHISWVLLTGPFAYKIKKPVRLPFLDFSTLRDRKHYCEEELRINRRLAPEIYLEVVPVTGRPEAPRVAGSGETIEYAVKMVQFPADERMDLVAARGGLGEEHVRRLAAKIAAFHLACDVAEPGSSYADSEHLRRELMDNFDALRAGELGPELRETLAEVRRFAARSLVDLGAEFRSRKRRGLVRECHGDMHLANMALHDGDVVIFDAIEFNEDLRWIDVMSDVAFLVMDLDYRDLAHLGRLFLNRYLEGTGDYAGLKVLRHYRVYRAMVRSKVAAIRAGQCEPDTSADREALEELAAHLRLAHTYLDGPRRTPLIITHGLSGSGKSWLSERLAMATDIVRVRSDVERKRLGEVARSRGGAPADLYSPEMTRRTYQALADQSRRVVAGGYPAIVDATFLAHWQREQFRALARELRTPLLLLALEAPAEVLEERIVRRMREEGHVSDADLEVLRAQQSAVEELTDQEREQAVIVDTSGEVDIERLARRVAASDRLPLEHRLEHHGVSRE